MIRRSIYFLTIICFGISGCAPYLTYDELNAEAELTKDYTEVEKFEAKVVRAEQYFDAKYACARAKECVWICIYRGGATPNRIKVNEYPADIDSLVRQWRREHTSCSPGTKGDVERIFSVF